MAVQVFPAQWADSLEWDEHIRVREWRRKQALAAGLGTIDAAAFADGDGSCEQLRRAAAAGADPALLAAIFT